MNQSTIRFGVIGLGAMGKEFAGAAARWRHLPEMDVRPEIVAICSRTLRSDVVAWFRDIAPSITQVTADYRDVLTNPNVDAVYVAVPHSLHEEVYTAAIRAGKHVFGEKPFGIDLPANAAILDAAAEQPDVLVRCASQFVFLPGAQAIGRMFADDAFGEILEATLVFQHSSDLNPQKPINWKRVVETNGTYGVMGDLGMHLLPLPLRAGWRPRNCRAVLSNIVPERPGPDGAPVACDTWDNATLLVETAAPGQERTFPLTMRIQRIAPGEMNTWGIEVLGTRASARFSTRNINVFHRLHYDGGDQNWETVAVGHAVAFRSITPGIFEVGFSDTILQLWAAYLYELHHGKPLSTFAGCMTPEETAIGHRLFTAAERSHRAGTTEAV